MPRYIAKPSTLKRLLIKITHLFKTRVLGKTVGTVWNFPDQLRPNDNRFVLLRTRSNPCLRGRFVRPSDWVSESGESVNPIAWREL